MNKILLINGSQPAGRAKGGLNKTLIDTAAETLTKKGREVKTTSINDGFSAPEEIDKFMWCEAVIFNFPVYWMGVPALFKKYIDEVYISSHGKMYAGDGRDLGKNYGQGGLMNGRKYMVTATWNAPATAFMTPGQFFEGKDADAVLYPFHKAQQFMGFAQLPSFHLFDVMRNPRVEAYLAEFREHLAKTFA
jgi:modulator of drug activity B